MNIFFQIACIVIFSSSLFGEIIPGDLSYLINKQQLPANNLAVYIKETKSNETVASLNIDKAMSPASVIKVYSAYAALLELGFDYRWPTQFSYTGKLSNGVITGDLVVKGYGDPTLETKDLAGIVSALKRQGVRKINGNIIIDRSYFTVSDKDSSGFDENIYSPYNAMPDAMMFNQHTSQFCITPVNGTYQLQKSIPGESYRVVNNLRTVSGSCVGAQSWPHISVDHSTDTPSLILSGNLSRNCAKKTICQIVTKPYKELYFALKQEIKKSGIVYNGSMRVGVTPAGAKNIYTHYSPTLENVISTTLKKSNNVFARHLLLTLGAKIYGAPGTLDKGNRAVMQILNRYTLLDTPKTNIDNGSGLSRVSRITARSMARVLDHAQKSYGTRWMKTLSIAGVDGTIKRRFQNSIVKNRAWMKTGTLDDAKNIVGYVKSNSDKLYTVVILVNNPQAAWKGKSLEDDIIKWLVAYQGGGRTGAVEPLPNALQDQENLWDQIKVDNPENAENAELAPS